MEIVNSEAYALLNAYQIAYCTCKTEDPEAQYSIVLQVDNAAGKYALHIGGFGKHEEAIPEQTMWIDPIGELRRYEALDLLRRAGWPKRSLRAGVDLVFSFFRLFLDKDLVFASLLPVAIYPDQGPVVRSVRMLADKDAFYRQAELGEHCLYPDHPLEEKARALGITYVDLGGDIVCLSGGAGSTMALADMIDYFGGRPANFIDTMGGAGSDVIRNLALITLERLEAPPRPKGLLLSMHLTATPMKTILTEFVNVFSSRPPTVRKAAYIQASGAGLYKYSLEEGQRLLESVGFEVYPRLDKAIKALIGKKDGR